MVREPGYGPLHLWKPNDEDDIVADICFVHGLGGHREHTWTKDDEKVKSCWPRDFLGQDINNVRTFTWGYDAEVVKFFGGNSELNLENLGDSLLQGIARFRKDTPEDRPLILVGHSLGGIVIKQAIIKSNRYFYNRTHPDLGNIFPCIKAVLFFATPHRGSQFANYGKVLAKITKVSLRRPNTSLLKLLQQGSMSLDAQRPAFNTAAGGIHIVCFYETIGKSWGFLDMKRIVDEESAKIEGREVKVIPINADHSNICKFGSRNEDNYKTAIYEFELVVKSIKKERELRAQNIQNQLNNQANEEQTELLQSLSFEFMSDVQATMKPHCGGTFEWLFEDSPSKKASVSFVDWLHSKDSIFWITGKPASGKSTLMAFIHRHKELERHLVDWVGSGKLVKAVTFIRRTSGSHLVRFGTGILRALLVQMIYQERQLIKVIKSAWKEKHQHLTFSETSGWSLDQLERAFKSCLHHKPPGVKLFLFVDGLDEFESMDDQDTLRKEKSHREKDNDLARLLQVLLDAKDRCDVKICFASRELRTIERKLGRNPSLRIHEHTEDDMKIYTDGLLDESRGAWKRFERQHPHPREVISRRIQEKASGVFTWVYIVVSNINYDLETTRTFHEIEKKVEESPGELCGQDGLYAEALKHHVPKAHRDKGLRMLYHALDFVSSNLWGQTPNCPLDPLSLVIAEDISWFEDDLKRSVPTTDLFPMLASQEECQDLFNLGKAWLKSFTGCLLELRQNQRGENAVVFVHETVREFLEERRTIHSDQMAITESGKSLLHLESCGRVTMASFLWDFHNFMARGLDLHDSRYTLRDEKLYNQALGLALDLAVFIDTQQINRPYNDRNSKSTEERMLLFLFNDPSGQDCFLGRIQASINTIYRSQPYLDFYLECFDGLFHRSILKKSKSRKLLRVYHDDVVFPLDVGFCHRTADPNEQWKGQTIWHRFLHRQIALERSNRPKRYPKVGECVTKLVLMGADMHTRLRMTPEMKDQLKSLERPNFFGKKFFSLDSFWGTKLDRSCSPAFLIACLILYRRLQMPDSLDTESWRIPRAQTRFPQLHRSVQRRNEEIEYLAKMNPTEHFEGESDKGRRQLIEIHIKRLVILLCQVHPIPDLQQEEVDEFSRRVTEKFEIYHHSPEKTSQLTAELVLFEQEQKERLKRLQAKDLGLRRRTPQKGF